MMRILEHAQPHTPRLPHRLPPRVLFGQFGSAHLFLFATLEILNGIQPALGFVFPDDDYIFNPKLLGGFEGFL
jgi:hypothetical protein